MYRLRKQCLKPSARNSLQRILIIKIGALGDIALSLTMLPVLKGAHITWIVGASSQELLEGVEGIDQKIIVDEKRLLQGSIFSKVFEVIKIWKKLFLKTFTLVITAHPDPRYRLLSLMCFKKKHRYFPLRKKERFPVSGIFHGESYIKLASPLVHPIVWPNLSLPDVGHLIDHRDHVPTIILAPGGDKSDAGKQLRIWPIEAYKHLEESLQNYDCQIVLVGVKDDAALGEHFVGAYTKSLIGKTGVLELIALLKHALGIVTHDGGTLHLARISGCQICALFGPTSPHDFAAKKEIVFWGGEDLKCRPCYTGKSFAKCDHQTCMKQISPEKVLSAIVHQWGLKRRENSHCS